MLLLSSIHPPNQPRGGPADAAPGLLFRASLQGCPLPHAQSSGARPPDATPVTRTTHAEAFHNLNNTQIVSKDMFDIYVFGTCFRLSGFPSHFPMWRPCSKID
jgi:hypothetical protein